MRSRRNIFAILGVYSLTNDLPLLQKDFRDPLMAVECDRHHVTFEAPRAVLQLGQLVSVDGSLIIANKPHEFSLTGKVVRVHPAGEGQCKYVIEMHSFDKESWLEFLTVHRQNQERVDQLFSILRDEV